MFLNVLSLESSFIRYQSVPANCKLMDYKELIFQLVDRFMQVAVVMNLTCFTSTKNARKKFKGFRRSGDKFKSGMMFSACVSR